MRIADDANEAAFRRELRSWLAEHLTPEIRRETFEAIHRGDAGPSRAWHGALHRAGFAARSWPAGYGGQGGTLSEDLILFEELTLAEAPNDIFRVGVRIVGPMLITLASEEQKRRLLPPTADGQILWSQGFSEPGAGSDLASLKARAEDRGDHFILTGQKVWNTFGHMAEYCLVLARTDPALPKHKGLTAFAVPLDLPGITIRPIPQMSGRSDFNEIFFDGVRLAADTVVGRVNGGWEVAVTMLDFERRGLAAAGFECQATYNRLVEVAITGRRLGGGRLIDDPAVRRMVAELGVQTRIAVLNNHRFAAMTGEGGIPGAEASVQKLHSTELNKSLHGAVLDLLMESDLCRPEGRDRLPVAYEDYLGAFGFTIGGGTAQIQRNIIAERVLGLPR
jgi:alkylation response protein AidB-like acyl-CoA dehydrogenase